MAHYFRFCPACKFTEDVEGPLPWGTFGQRVPCPKCGTYMGFSANAPRGMRDTPEATITPRTHNLEGIAAKAQVPKVMAPEIETKVAGWTQTHNMFFQVLMRRAFGDESALPGYEEV